MNDPRNKKAANILVNYSLKVKKGENVILASDIEGKPLALEVYKLLIKAGASEIRVKLGSYEFDEAFFKLSSEVQLKHFPKIADFETRNVDCVIRICAPTNTRYLSGVDERKIALHAKTTQSIQDWRVEKTRWVITRYPTNAQAQEADMCLDEYCDFVYEAITKVDWKKKFKEQEVLRKLLDKTIKVRIVGEGTDLTMSIAGRKAENAGGEYNMPDGEVFTSAIENSAHGYITYTYPALYHGKEFTNVRLEFNKGKVVFATSDKNESDLNRILDSDRGARFIGELGIGNNFAIKRFTKDILFDEKIGGSIHIALGMGYKKTLSKNESSIHWDMIKDLRTGGELWLDEKLVQKNGKWEIIL